MKANQIEMMETIFTAKLEYIEGENMSSQDQFRVDCLMEILENTN
jgi:hypothetical protein